MDGKMLARLGAVVFVAVAVTATAIETTRNEEEPEAWLSGRSAQTQVDPLREELLRCQGLGEAGPRDASCLRAWAENRNRFLAPGARPAERLSNVPAAPRDPSAHPGRASDPALEPAAPITPQLLEEVR
jgi:conjugative transfer region protein TrbK